MKVKRGNTKYGRIQATVGIMGMGDRQNEGLGREH